MSTIKLVKLKRTTDFSNVVVETEQGTELVDTNCLDWSALKEDLSLGDWHTISGDYDEPQFPIDNDIQLQLITE